MIAELIQTFALEDTPANEAFPADINDDGKMEYLFLQSPGIYQSKLFCGGEAFWDSPYDASNRTRRNDFCLTARDSNGKILWQYGEPKPYVDGLECFTHVADQMLCCGDFDKDGKTEVVFIHGNNLIMLEGSSGNIIRKTCLESDNFTIVCPVKTKNGNLILVKNSEKAYSPHWYGDPALIYDHELNLTARIPKTIGSGHSPRAFDIDGDGDEELLIGYEAYRANGEHIWTLEGIDGDSYNPEDHVDQLQIGRFGEDGLTKIVYAGSHFAYVADLEGKLIWEKDLTHPQHVLIGYFVHGGSHAHLAFLNNILENNIFFLRYDGRFVNTLNPSVNWPEMPEYKGKAHSGEGILIYPQGCSDGSDAVITRDWGWPKVFSLNGTEPFEFPFPGMAEYKKPPLASREEYKNTGIVSGTPLCTRESYGVRICDVDNDGQAEVLIHNLRNAWVFKPPYPVRKRENTHNKLIPVTGQGFYAV